MIECQHKIVKFCVRDLLVLSCVAANMATTRLLDDFQLQNVYRKTVTIQNSAVHTNSRSCILNICVKAKLQFYVIQISFYQCHTVSSESNKKTILLVVR